MKKVEIVLLSIIGSIAVATAKPQDLGFLTFKDGKIGVNFGGYHAEAGLGGLLGGGHTAGGLHASAGTPFGANAQAGLGGVLDGNGYSGGRLHASAGLGQGNPQAAAGIGGEVAGPGTQGGYYAGATSGVAAATSVSKSVETQSYGLVQPSVVGKTVETQVFQTVPAVQVEKKVETRFSEAVPDLRQKIVETHVYQSAPIQPTVVNVQHTEKVHTRIRPKKQKTRITTRTKYTPSVQSGVIVEKVVQPEASWSYQKFAGVQANGVQNVGYPVPLPGPGVAAAGVGGTAAIAGGVAGAGYGGGYQTNYENNYYVKSQPNGQFFDDVFNIPISTLTAVNQLLRNKGK